MTACLCLEIANGYCREKASGTSTKMLVNIMFHIVLFYAMKHSQLDKVNNLTNITSINIFITDMILLTNVPPLRSRTDLLIPACSHNEEVRGWECGVDRLRI